MAIVSGMTLVYVIVLILIVMEDTHWVGVVFLFVCIAIVVLILIVMEDTHWGISFSKADKENVDYWVLILIVMEDTHWVIWCC